VNTKIVLTKCVNACKTAAAGPKYAYLQVSLDNLFEKVYHKEEALYKKFCKALKKQPNSLLESNLVLRIRRKKIKLLKQFCKKMHLTNFR